MYGVRAFASTWHVVVGGLFFSALFTVIAILTESIFSGRVEITGWVMSVGVTSFVGYLLVAHFLRFVDERP